KLLQAGELRCVAALRGGVDDEHRLAGVVDKPNVAAVKGGEREHIGGDPAHGRRLCKRSGRCRKGGGEGTEKLPAITGPSGPPWCLVLRFRSSPDIAAHSMQASETREH